MMNDVIGFGTFPMKEVLEEIIPQTVGKGFSFVDTSDDYYNETFVARGAAGTQLKIFTKFSLVNHVLHFDSYVEAQMKLYKEHGLKVHCYLIHWPYPFLYKKIWRRMEKLYLDGIVEEIGVCNFTVKHLQELMKDCRVKPMYNQIELHPLFQQKEVTRFCAEKGIRVISYSPFARMDPELFANETINKIAQDHKTTIHNVILKWNLQKGFIPIPSTSKASHLESMSLTNLNQIALSEQELEAIDALDKAKRVRFDPDTYFSGKTKLKLLVYSLLMR